MNRKVLNRQLWPEADRAAWDVALDPGDVFDGRGPAAHWSAGSRRSIGHGYGRWLGYLAREEPESLDLAPADRVTRDRVRRFHDHLVAEISPVGVFNYLKQLYDAIRVMAPERDWPWLKAIVWRLDRTPVRANKAARMVTADRLIELGLHLMSEANPDSGDLDDCRAYRDGLIIALLASRPIRRRNLAMIRIGRHLVRTGQGWHLVFAADEMKNHKPYEAPLPEFLVPYLERYLDEVRPRLPGALDDDALWPSIMGRPLAGPGLYEVICKRTKVAFGLAINPHFFRDIAATEIAYRDPAHIGIARDLLGHSDLRAVDHHYVQARQIEAGRAYQEDLLAERARLAQTRPSRSRRR